MSYYQNALEALGQYDQLFVFSDDIDWCKANFKFDKMTFIGGEKDYVELFLMASCHDHIIANSSFSWWGAWLSTNKDKKVVGPLKWFGPAYDCWSTEDIMPKEWKRI
jgi:hypothetical protein